MGQKSLMYAFVARGTVILAEHTEFSGNFNSIHSLPESPEASGHQQQVHLQLRRSHLQLPRRQWLYALAYCVVADESVGRQVPIAFLERAKDDFVVKYGGGKAATAAANSLNKEFGSKLKEHMQYCVDHPEEIGKLAKVKAQVSEVKGVMMENIEKVLDRGEKIELLVDKTETLHHQAQNFRNVGTEMRRKMWLQNMKVRLREERREMMTGVRGRSAGPRVRAESMDARAMAGRGDHC
ncbi:putative Longin-like domain-containing protein [Rosa chinensis]|uniref:Putative Longin-like domain-containing protein n=1 Tax=Rosa chinensis TaxID=74649 RepID=A0A2P6R540_ROSCH|nr:putative Longin-like domain-containing protein [Rosa chinensis]